MVYATDYLHKLMALIRETDQRYESLYTKFPFPIATSEFQGINRFVFWFIFSQSSYQFHHVDISENKSGKEFETYF